MAQTYQVIWNEYYGSGKLCFSWTLYFEIIVNTPDTPTDERAKMGNSLAFSMPGRGPKIPQAIQNGKKKKKKKLAKMEGNFKTTLIQK